MDAARGLEQPRVAKVGEGIQVGVGDRPDAAAVAAVTAVRTTERHVLEAQDANAAVAALAAFDADNGFVNQLHRSRLWDRLTSNAQKTGRNFRRHASGIPQRDAPGWRGTTKPRFRGPFGIAFGRSGRTDF